MDRSILERWGGPAAAVGGSLWMVGLVLVAQLPEGCIMAECDLPGRSHRDSGAGAPILFIGLLLIGLGVVAVSDRRRRVGRPGALDRLGLVVSVAGLAVLTAAALVQALAFGGDFPLMPYFVVPAGLALVVGMLALGLSIMRSGVPRAWAGALLLIGTLTLLWFNDQNARVLLGIPFGLAWVALGCLLWLDRPAADAKASL